MHSLSKLPTPMVFSVNAWIDVPPCFIQRDTEKHLAGAVRKHLRSYLPSQARVAMAMFPDGRTMKLDGHTRALAWQTGKLERPPEILVDVYAVTSLAEVKALYNAFDNKAAVETTPDRVSGALREHDVRLTSSYLLSYRFHGALVLSTGLDYTSDAIFVAREALMQIDTITPSPKRLPVGVLGAALLTLRADPKTALNFWKPYNADKGTRTDTGSDGIDMLSREIVRMRSEKLYGERNTRIACGIALAAYEGWRRDKRFKKSIGALIEPSYYARLRNVPYGEMISTLSPARALPLAAPLSADPDRGAAQLVRVDDITDLFNP